jgi:hypothetical protein
MTEAAKPPLLTRLGLAATKRSKGVLLYKGRWKTAAAVAALLVIASWIATRDRRPAPLGPSTVRRSNGSERHVPSGAPKPVLTNRATSSQTTPDLREEARKTARTMPQWVRVGNNELDYVAQDVTVRHFTPKPLPQPVQSQNNQVRSEDMTVRDFTPQPLPRPVQSRNSRVRYISEDVTVRDFTAKPTVEPSHPIASGAQPVAR